MSLKFPIHSDQLTLLIHLEYSTSLEQLASLMHKEKSVISKNLKALHTHFPSLLEKRDRRWEVTKQGQAVNRVTHKYLSELNGMISGFEQKESDRLYNSKNSVFMVVNPQKAFESPDNGPMSNPRAVENIRLILDCWRALGRQVIFVQHQSKNPESALAPGSQAAEFIEVLEPLPGERVLKKSVLSAFHDVDLVEDLNADSWDSLILSGFTAGECMDATAKEAHDSGIPTYVIADAVSTSNLMGPNGEVFHSKLVLGVTLASLHRSVASLLDTDTLLSEAAL